MVRMGPLGLEEAWDRHTAQQAVRRDSGVRPDPPVYRPQGGAKRSASRAGIRVDGSESAVFAARGDELWERAQLRGHAGSDRSRRAENAFRIP